ncbi:alpha/beta hydrolase family protein [Parathalassolituus penaei]|uniref:Prolyl oligopeptidase family serine peptidase n=1 Tax=Parathalassolituus penaei TaxID=2997323 RepID=A0A9X3EJI7_9GAMM|nr:prolyl oligopeptidase family serine peptidase [Parathalassolituus penaei]MCY0963703.1 prolyl oligopeptidase family serine peptidase [Parathalassolituus penaei]
MSSELSSHLAAHQGKLWAELRVSADYLAWLEFDPADGRNRICVRGLPGQSTAPVRRLVSSPWSVRSRVHEYGGGAYCWVGQWLLFVNDADQGLYWQSVEDPHALPSKLWYQAGHRYGDLRYDPVHQRLLMVEEIHCGHQVENRLVALPLERLGMEATRAPQVLFCGTDFCSSPRISPCGQYMAWLSWNHPNQPWLAAALTLAELDSQGFPLDRVELISESANTAVFQPEFDDDSNLCFVADQPPISGDDNHSADNWWNLYRYRFARREPDDDHFGSRLHSGCMDSLLVMHREFGVAQWQLGLSTWCVLPGQRLLASWFDRGLAGLLELNTDTAAWQMRQSGLARCHSLQALPSGGAVLLTEQADQPTCLAWLDDQGNWHWLEHLDPDPLAGISAQLSVPVAFACPTADDEPLWGFYYPPTAPSDGPLPPLLIQIHGGPTSMADVAFDMQRLFWSSRGFALLVLNYRGSSGFGRHYRLQLQGQWGISDVEDVQFAAIHAARCGWADPQRIFVRGNSAGGYTVLRLLSGAGNNDVRIRAGASHYGISDLALLNQHTHKFESRYLHWLIGDPQLQAERYQQRSPIFEPESRWKPVIFFQGQNDRVVPAEQTRNLHDMLARRGRVSEYHLFSGEGHGFRQARHRQQVLERELAFYRMFG